MGDRFEFGRIEDANGWMATIYQVRDQDQGFQAASADMIFNDPVQGSRSTQLLIGNVNSDVTTPAVIEPLPVTFYDVKVSEVVDTWGVELNYLHRFMTCHDGGTFEMFLGARYLEFNDHFHFSSGVTPATIVPNTPAYSFLQESTWDTEAGNHIVGPEIGLRYFKRSKAAGCSRPKPASPPA